MLEAPPNMEGLASIEVDEIDSTLAEIARLRHLIAAEEMCNLATAIARAVGPEKGAQLRDAARSEHGVVLTLNIRLRGRSTCEFGIVQPDGGVLMIHRLDAGAETLQ